jgi:hypothetical protein
VGIGVVGADAHHLGLGGMEGAQFALEAAGLERAATGEILWLEVENQPPAPEILQAALHRLDPALCRGLPA